jgi:hypothetical protein
MSAPAASVHDFHTHTYLSDGELSPVELIRRAAVNGYVTLGITDHCGVGDLARIIGTLSTDRDAVREAWPEIEVYVGVELTHLPPEVIPQAAYRARVLGLDQAGATRSPTATSRARAWRPARRSWSTATATSRPGCSPPRWPAGSRAAPG